MTTRSKAPRRTRRGQGKAEAPPQAPAPEGAEAPPQDGPDARVRQGAPRVLLVELVEDANGQASVLVRHQGVSQFEAPTLLRMAARVCEQNLGLRDA